MLADEAGVAAGTKGAKAGAAVPDELKAGAGALAGGGGAGSKSRGAKIGLAGEPRADFGAGVGCRLMAGEAPTGLAPGGEKTEEVVDRPLAGLPDAGEKKVGTGSPPATEASPEAPESRRASSAFNSAPKRSEALKSPCCSAWRYWRRTVSTCAVVGPASAAMAQWTSPTSNSTAQAARISPLVIVVSD